MKTVCAGDKPACNKYVALETARKLKEAGCKQESEWYYLKLDTWSNAKIVTKQEYLNIKDTWHYDGTPLVEFCYSAYCSCELLEQLPATLDGYKHLTVRTYDFGQLWKVGYADFDLENYQDFIELKNVSLVEAVASLYLWCKKEGYIK